MTCLNQPKGSKMHESKNHYKTTNVQLQTNNKYKIQEPFGAEAEGALVMISIDSYYLLFHKDFLTHNTIAHEIFHAAVRVTEDRDITDEEAQAWLAGHLTGEIYKFFEKKNLNITHG